MKLMFFVAVVVGVDVVVVGFVVQYCYVPAVSECCVENENEARRVSDASIGREMQRVI
jgi:hypothetical protein